MWFTRDVSHLLMSPLNAHGLLELPLKTPLNDPTRDVSQLSIAASEDSRQKEINRAGLAKHLPVVYQSVITKL